MDHYQEFRLLPDPEFPSSVLLSALFAKVHRALVELPAPKAGISFPDYDATRQQLGDRLRLHSRAAVLSALGERPWLSGMRDHLAISPPSLAPATSRSVRVSRVQAKSSPARLRRRLARRHGLSPAAALARLPIRDGERLALPWLEVRSASTGQSFRLFIDQEVLPEPPVIGEFGHYGLSATGTLPWF